MTQRTISDLLADDTIVIPEHQRAYVWTSSKQSGLIDTIMESLPTHALFLYQSVVDGKIQQDLEDGQQRWMTVKKFVNNEFMWKPVDQPTIQRKYSDLTSAEQAKFQRYQFAICQMTNMTLETRLSLFQRLQDGIPLSNGQRFNAASNLPIVKLAKELMKDPRCHEAWGDHKETKTNTVLANAMAIASGLALGDTDLITTSYGILGPVLYKHKATPINKELVEERLIKLLSVYTRVDTLHPISATKKKQQWNVGKYTGYILYTILQTDRNWLEDLELWANYIVGVRRDETTIRILRYNAPPSRNWNALRWQQGLQNVESPESITGFSELFADDAEEDE